MKIIVIGPFGQVPAIDGDGLVLFESGAIVLHIGERCETLLPADIRQRARAITWSFAALNSIEPPLQKLGLLYFLRAKIGRYSAAYSRSIRQSTP